jgi:hypothetical protein
MTTERAPPTVALEEARYVAAVEGHQPSAAAAGRRPISTSAFHY